MLRKRHAKIVRSFCFAQDLLSRTTHHYVLAHVLQPHLLSNISSVSFETDQVCFLVVGLDCSHYFPVHDFTRYFLIDDQAVNSYFSYDSVLEIFGDVLGVQVPGIVGGDGFSAFEIVVDFFPVEDIEDGLSTGVHEVLIDVVHAVIDEYIPYSLGLVVLKLLSLFNQVLIYFVVILRLFVLVLEQEVENNCPGLSSINDLQNYENYD